MNTNCAIILQHDLFSIDELQLKLNGHWSVSLPEREAKTLTYKTMRRPLPSSVLWP